MAKSITSFKKGNKASVGNHGGRPRSYEPEVEAAAIIEWAKTDEALVLRKFAPIRGYAPSRMDDWIINCPCFREAYAIAKQLIGSRLQEILIYAGSTKPFDRYADLYDDDLLAHEQAKTVFESKNKSKHEQETLEETVRKIAEGPCRGQKS